MVRVKSDAYTKAAVKAPRKQNVLRSVSGTTPKVNVKSGNKYAGGNSYCVRPTPDWQKPITSFFPKNGSQEESAKGNDPKEDIATCSSAAVCEDAPGCSKDIPYEDAPACSKDIASEDAPACSKDASYEDAPGCSKDVSYEDAPGCSTDVSYEDAPGCSKDVSYEDAPGCSKDVSYEDSPSCSEVTYELTDESMSPSCSEVTYELTDESMSDGGSCEELVSDS